MASHLSYFDPNNAPQNDEAAMQMALDVAAQAMFITSPNPRVGCVVIKDGRVLAIGHTQAPGQGHAEVEALRMAAERGADIRGATAYVTLEPCSHYGRTPPCADALVKSGIKRVVAAMVDSNPQVAGAGLKKLSEAGIETRCGVLAEAAREMNIGFFSRMERGRPWVRLKMATSLDAKAALRDGSSKWITSQAARDDGHIWRARACAVLTGSGTVLHDDPEMTVRAISTPRQPRRIVLDSTLSISPDAKILEGGGTWVMTTSAASEKSAILSRQGTELIRLPGMHGRIDLHAMLNELGKRQINELHVEAGSTLSGALIESGCVDELLLYVAPSLIGPGRDGFALPELESLQHQRRLAFKEVKQIGTDLRILARFI